MLTTRVTQRLLKRQTIGAISQTRFLATEAPTKPEKYGTFRQAPSGIGAREPPVVDHQNWFQRKKQKLRDFTDYEKAFAAHAAERRHLVQEATKSYFADVHEMRQHGGKMYYAPTQLYKADKTGFMPDFEGKDLNGNKLHTTEKMVGKITLMSFVYAKYGEPHVDTFIKPFLEKYKDSKDIQVVEVNVQENLMKQWLLKAFVPSIRKNLADNRKDNYVLLMKDISRTRKSLDMSNQYIGYVYLVDQDCKVRWTAHGEATPEELGNLLAMTDYLNEKRLLEK
ncbi:hypothetical protein K501DRAFT_226590 [Backusella circina FSU 941]|nr:hypothetical protein K501DRAFT_226590 [Backusella circina FSU 941]